MFCAELQQLQSGHRHLPMSRGSSIRELVTNVCNRTCGLLVDPHAQMSPVSTSTLCNAAAHRGSPDCRTLMTTGLVYTACSLLRRVWEQKKMQQPPRFPKLDRDLEVDVCVVGAGISGLSVAYALAKEGVSGFPRRSGHKLSQCLRRHRASVVRR